ncbi:MAG: hypothetical protein KKF52_02540 [Nanoarchaeota archaeon]|nr:hypothetical protein [Nanoarchaeota archaeon]MBU4242087.1 hypothetical protein [Nanoarchaeota archaeon]MBU4352494.1 hypothetical protein [Nanoarchaeota archaeon]MCG2719245.1 hypothetical protein [Nanoarchaeota archaeon]
MQKIKILNSKEIKKILKELEYFGFKDKLNYAFLKNNDDKIFLLSKKFGEIDTARLRINNLGLYFGKQEKSGIRLTIEGTQLIKPSKNVIELDDKQIRQWILGKDLEIKSEAKGFLVIKNKNDFFGCGAYKDGKLLNYIPKNRRLTSKNID